VDAQSIVVAATAANLNGQEGAILLKVLGHRSRSPRSSASSSWLRYVFPHLVAHGIKLLVE